MDPAENLIMALYASRPGQAELSGFERLLDQFSRHEMHERKFVEQYRGIVDGIESPLVKFLLRLILSDEEKHHDLVRTISAGLRKDLEWIKGGADMPKLGKLPADRKEELLALTDEFIKAERQTITEYQALLSQSEGYRKGLPPLLLRIIIHDSEKHLMILQFLHDRLEDAESAIA